MAERTNFDIFRGTSTILRFTLVVPEPEPDYVNGWTTEFHLKEKANDTNTVLHIPGAISTIQNATEYGIFDVVISAANSATLVEDKKYAYSFRRTNAGFEDVLAYGELTARTVS